jgi:hypothetical protein
MTMRRYILDIIVFATLTIAAILIFTLTIGERSIDIQLYDTYFVLTALEKIILIVGPLAFLTFLSLALTRKFKTTSTNIGLIIALVLISLIIFQVAMYQRSYRDYISSYSELMALPLQIGDRERFINDMNTKINLTWGFLGICITGIGLTSFRTYKLVTGKK